jgi:hypothetical protein
LKKPEDKGGSPMKDKDSLHGQVQAHCDCFASTDPLREMSLVPSETDAEAAAVKWIALAALHGVNANAEKISIIRSAKEGVTVVAKYRDSELPSPGDRVGDKIIEAMREITHLDGDKGKMPFALGIRDSSVALEIKIESKNGREKLTFKFPG